MVLHVETFKYEFNLVNFVNRYKIPQERIQAIIYNPDATTHNWVLYWWE